MDAAWKESFLAVLSAPGRLAVIPDPDGTPTRWTFTEIASDSFHWLGEALMADGKTWNLEGDFRARRLR